MSPHPRRFATVSDAELILIGGLLLAAGIAAAKVADRVRVPGLLLFLGLGMLVGPTESAGSSSTTSS